MILLLYFYIYTNEGFYKTYLFYMLEYVEMYINIRRAVFISLKYGGMCRK